MSTNNTNSTNSTNRDELTVSQRASLEEMMNILAREMLEDPHGAACIAGMVGAKGLAPLLGAGNIVGCRAPHDMDGIQEAVDCLGKDISGILKEPEGRAIAAMTAVRFLAED